MVIKPARLISFTSASYRAVVQIASSEEAYLTGVTTARNIPATEMTPGRKLLVMFLDEHNPETAVVIAVYN